MIPYEDRKNKLRWLQFDILLRFQGLILRHFIQLYWLRSASPLLRCKYKWSDIAKEYVIEKLETISVRYALGSISEDLLQYSESWINSKQDFFCQKSSIIDIPDHLILPGFYFQSLSKPFQITTTIIFDR